MLKAYVILTLVQFKDQGISIWIRNYYNVIQMGIKLSIYITFIIRIRYT